MAYSYSDDDAPESLMRLDIVQTALRWTGAAVSVSLVLGLGVWSYRMMVRDISGVPVIQAMGGPTRTAPEDPGGHKAAHQGLSVNRIAALGEAAPPADTVTLAPRPVALAAEDRPVSLQPVARPGAVPDRVILASARPGDTPRLAAEPGGRPSGDAETLARIKGQDAAALAEDAAARAEDAAPAAPEQTAAPEPAADQTEQPAPASRFGIALDAALAEALGVKTAVLRSPRPAIRPGQGDLRLAALETGATTGTDALAGPLENPVAATGPVDPDTLPVGTRLVQLGAYDDRAEAEAAWQQIEARFGDYLDGRRPVIQSAESNGRSFYRLRALGFADDGDARRFCAALLAEQANCIPVMIR